MPQYPGPIQRLIEAFGKLPGIGLRSAERMAFHVLKQTTEDAMRLADAIGEVKTRIRVCSTCFSLTDVDPCAVCTDARRDQGLVCVVETPKDMLAMEMTGAYRGAYHVLLGLVAPLEGRHKGETTLAQLVTRLETGGIRELILGTSPNVNGDSTALEIQEIVRERFPNVALTRLARGLASGTNLEHASIAVLADAIAGRQRM